MTIGIITFENLIGKLKQFDFCERNQLNSTVLILENVECIYVRQCSLHFIV